jgi:hypothetical protein
MAAKHANFEAPAKKATGGQISFWGATINFDKIFF